MATTKPTFQNATGDALTAPRYNFSDIPVPPGKYITGDFYLGYNTIEGISTGERVYEVLGFTNVSSGSDPDLADIVYDYTLAEVVPVAGIPVSEKGVANGVATLDINALLDTDQLPPLSITNSYSINSEAAMLALTAQMGDVAIRSDISKSFILATNSPGTLVDWKELLGPGITGTLTSGRIPYATGTSQVSDDAGLTYDAATDTLTTGTVTQKVGNATTLRATAPATVTITNTTNATPIVVTATGHGLVTGDAISISGITGNTNANGYFRITKLSADTFSLQNYSTGANIAGNGAHGGTPVAVTGIVQGEFFALGNAAAATYGIRLLGGNTIDFLVAGARRFSVSATNSTFFTNAFTVGSSGDNFFSWPAAATLQLGAAASATPVAQTLQAQGSRGGTDVNVAGGNLTIKSGAGTGNSTVSKIILQTPSIDGSGSTQQTQASRVVIDQGGMQVNGNAFPGATDQFSSGIAVSQWAVAYVSRSIQGSKTKTFTNNTKTGFVTIAVSNSTIATGTIIYEIFVADATNTQAISGELKFSAAANSSGTVTAATADAFTPLNPCTSGTLTNAITQTTGANTLTIEFQPNTSLTSTVREIRWRVNTPGTETITPL